MNSLNFYCFLPVRSTVDCRVPGNLKATDRVKRMASMVRGVILIRQHWDEGWGRVVLFSE